MGGNELNRSQLAEKLSKNWHHSEEITDFIIKYWYSIKYAMSAQKRGANCSFISMASLILAGWLWYSQAQVWLIFWSVANAISLGMIGNKVNKALFILMHEQTSPQWNLACVSFTALSEILGNEYYQFFVSNFLPKDRVEYAINLYAK